MIGSEYLCCLFRLGMEHFSGIRCQETPCESCDFSDLNVVIDCLVACLCCRHSLSTLQSKASMCECATWCWLWPGHCMTCTSACPALNPTFNLATTSNFSLLDGALCKVHAKRRLCGGCFVKRKGLKRNNELWKRSKAKKYWTERKQEDRTMVD